MIIAVDVGGTKTLVAGFDTNQQELWSVKFETPHAYEEFLPRLIEEIKKQNIDGAVGIVVGLPGRLDRKNGIGIAFGNLNWKNIHIVDDIRKDLDLPVFIENDAKLAALAEAQEHPDNRHILYITISTGIGTGVVTNGRLNPSLINTEGGHILLPHDGGFISWEKLASGLEITHDFHQRASEITDPAVWEQIAHHLTPGFGANIAIVAPDLVIVGGGVGHYLENFKDTLVSDLRVNFAPVVTLPPIVRAVHPDEAVIYGCYHYGKQVWNF